MIDVNKIILMGRLGADPIRRETKAGQAVVHFSLATSRRMTKETQEDGSPSVVEDTQWHRVVTWGKQADHCAQHLKKGAPVFLEGSIRSRKFESNDGVPRYSFEVHADYVNFLQWYPRKLRSEAPPSEDAQLTADVAS